MRSTLNYEIRHGKNRLITRLREELDTYDVTPTAVHNALVRLKVSPIFTTNYDDLIEKEWVDKAKKILVETKDDPYRREREINKLQIEYVRKRYGRTISDAGQ